MSKYTREPTPDEFLNWVQNNKEDWEVFYYDFMLESLHEAEVEDFFGTEGFDKRYG